MKIVRKIIHIDEEKCNGCGQCILSCAEGAIVLRDGKAKVIGDMYCDGLGACMGSCPTDALTIVEREAAPFDEKAVEELLAAQGQTHQGQLAPEQIGPEPIDPEQVGRAQVDPERVGHGQASPEQANREYASQEQMTRGQGMFKGCPGGRAESFQPTLSATNGRGPEAGWQMDKAPSPLSAGHISGITPHWPVKLRLASPDAPYLQGVHLYLAADCSAFAAMNFHSLMTKTPTALLTFCPKFESRESIMDKLHAIFATNNILSCTTIRMEVPCCAAMLRHTTEVLNARDELADHATSIPHTDIILSRQGERVLA